LTGALGKSTLTNVLTAPDDTLTALADPTRRAVLESLRRGPRSVGDIAAGLPVSRPAVSQHLRVLADARLVTSTPVGTRRLYAIDPEGLIGLRAWVEGFWTDALARFKTLAEEDSP
jgi:DNA-binding transcriptional ArsR family regulator